jgi:hypothetical protein
MFRLKELASFYKDISREYSGTNIDIIFSFLIGKYLPILLMPYEIRSRIEIVTNENYCPICTVYMDKSIERLCTSCPLASESHRYCGKLYKELVEATIEGDIYTFIVIVKQIHHRFMEIEYGEH